MEVNASLRGRSSGGIEKGGAANEQRGVGRSGLGSGAVALRYEPRGAGVLDGRRKP